MTQREEAIVLARQIADNRSDLGWLAPLANEFLAMVEREAARMKPDMREYFKVLPGGITYARDK